MFGYAPTVNDESGAIRGQGIVNAAQMNAQAKVKLVDDIGSALVSVAGAFGEAGELAQQGDSAYEALGAIGEMYPGMKSTYSALGKMDKQTRRMASMNILGNLGAVSQMGIAGMNNQTRTNAPFINAGLDNAADVAAGNRTFTGGGGGGGNIDRGGMKPVEPPFTMDGATPPDENAPLPPNAGAPNVAPSPAPTPAQTMPGGAQSKEAYNRWLRSQGLPPIP
jgi:hypothetical protein